MDVMGRVRLRDGTELSVVTGIDHSRFCVSALLVEGPLRRLAVALRGRLGLTAPSFYARWPCGGGHRPI